MRPGDVPSRPWNSDAAKHRTVAAHLHTRRQVLQQRVPWRGAILARDASRLSPGISILPEFVGRADDHERILSEFHKRQLGVLLTCRMLDRERQLRLPTFLDIFYAQFKRPSVAFSKSEPTAIPAKRPCLLVTIKDSTRFAHHIELWRTRRRGGDFATRLRIGSDRLLESTCRPLSDHHSTSTATRDDTNR